MVFGSAITLTCIVELNSAIVETDLSLLNVSAQLFREGTPLTLPDPVRVGITFNYTIQLNSFSIADIGNYTCNATIKPQSSATYLDGDIVSPSIEFRVTTGKIIPA